jgi:tetratricopeptide (TPR) repeat protein
MGPALSHAENAVNLHPKLAEALFQAGKVYMALGEPDNALPLLGKAIDLDNATP